MLLCAALAAVGGCSSAETAPSGSGPSAPPARPSGLVLPTAADAAGPEAVATEQLARRFLVPDEVSRGYALGVARDKGGMGRDARVCTSWLRVGQDNALLATEYVVGSGPDCEGWAALLESARRTWQERGRPSEGPSPTGEPRAAERPSGELADVQRASVGRFFTVAVSPYSFRHPLFEAHAGLPAWVLRASQTEPSAVPRRCEPRFVREKVEARGSEIAGYECAERPVAFEHVTAQELADTELSARTDALASFRSWQQALARQYADAIPARIERLERLWTRYPEGGLP